jgi:hypothetical protein
MSCSPSEHRIRVAQPNISAQNEEAIALKFKSQDSLLLLSQVGSDSCYFRYRDSLNMYYIADPLSNRYGYEDIVCYREAMRYGFSVAGSIRHLSRYLTMVKVSHSRSDCQECIDSSTYIALVKHCFNMGYLEPLLETANARSIPDNVLQNAFNGLLTDSLLKAMIVSSFDSTFGDKYFCLLGESLLYGLPNNMYRQDGHLFLREDTALFDTYIRRNINHIHNPYPLYGYIERKLLLGDFLGICEAYSRMKEIEIAAGAYRNVGSPLNDQPLGSGLYTFKKYGTINLDSLCVR